MLEKFLPFVTDSSCVQKMKDSLKPWVIYGLYEINYFTLQDKKRIEEFIACLSDKNSRQNSDKLIA